MPELGQDFLPPELAGFTFDRFDRLKRVMGDPFGQASQQWVYQKGDVSAFVSIDYPYDGIHDLSECYTATGWRVDPSSREIISADRLPASLANGESGEIATASMSRELHGNGLLLFSLVESDGVPRALMKSLKREASGDAASARLRSFAKARTNEAVETVRYGGPFVQFQLFAVSPRELSPEQRDEVMKLYLAARRLLMPRSVEALQRFAADKNSAAPTQE
jgi:hypothetical protein